MLLPEHSAVGGRSTVRLRPPAARRSPNSRTASRSRSASAWPSSPSTRATARQLYDVADAALYWAKNHGKNRSCVYSPSVVRSYTPTELAEAAERHARLRAAEGLIRVVDAKDTYAGRALADGVAAGRGASPARWASTSRWSSRCGWPALLHDLGKIAIPDRILQKPGKLDPDELRGHARAPRARRAPARGPGRLARRPLDPAPPRVVGRLRLPARPLRRGDPARLAHHPGRRRLRRDDLGSLLPRGRDVRRRRSPSCASAAGRSSTPASWRRSSGSRPRSPSSATVRAAG